MFREKTYRYWNAYLANGRNKMDRPAPFGTHTRIVKRSDSTIAVKYHATDVITYCADGSIVLDSGGWRTTTTKSRMTMYTPFSVYQSDYLWYITYKDSDGIAREVIFTDGITFTPEGRGYRVEDTGTLDIKGQKKLVNMIHEYAKGFVDALMDGEIGLPGPGDCWFCYMQVNEGDNTLGEAVKDTDHLLSHMEEKYYVPSLLWRVIETGRISPICHDLVLFLMTDSWTETDNEWIEKICRAQLVSAIRKYMHRQLGLADNVQTRY